MAGSPSNPLESTVRTSARDEIRRRGGWIIVKHQTGRGERGVPDLLGCYRGIPLILENKRPRGGREVTIEQRRQLAAARAAGAVACVIRSRKEIQTLLDAIDRYITHRGTPVPPVDALLGPYAIPSVYRHLGLDPAEPQEPPR